MISGNRAALAFLNPEEAAEAQARTLYTCVDAMLESFGGHRRPIEPGRTVLEFVESNGLELDGRVYDFDRYKHWRDIYEDNAREKVVMAAAQTGKTGFMFADQLRQMVVEWGKLFGFYLPTLHMATTFSSERWAPFAKSQPAFRDLLGMDFGTRQGRENVLTRTFGESTMFFMTSAGKTATEGLPLQGIWLDEVRRMARGDIERIMKRYAAQDAPTDMKVSTAFFPEQDIHAWFLRGDQRYFHTACNCPDGVVLSLSWPNCVVDLKSVAPEVRRAAEHAYSRAGVRNFGRRDDEVEKLPPAAYRCPKCGTWLPDPRDGWWEPHNDGAWVHSYQMPRLLAPQSSAGTLLYQFANAKDVQEFWNSELGLPYIDEEKRPLRDSHLRACVDTRLPWAAHKSRTWREKHLSNTGAGVDVQAGYLVLCIKQRAPNGKFRVIHLEIIEDHGTDEDGGMWKDLARRIVEYDVSVCVVDNAPEWSSAHRLATALPGRVWLATYDTSDTGSQSAPIASWGDKRKDKKQKGETKFKHTVRIHRVRGLRWSLERWVRRVNEIPDPRQLMQHLPVQNGKVILTAHLRVGDRVPVPIAETFFLHLLSIMFLDIYENPETKPEEEARRQGRTKQVAEYIGDIDPHFAHASLYSDVALARAVG